MLEKIKKMMENSLLAKIAFGCSVAVAITTGIMAIASFILILYSAWWLIGFFLFPILCGVSGGFSVYLYDGIY